MNLKNKKIVIVDYQMSNLFSVKHAFTYLGYDCTITSNSEIIKDADGAVLPGVGAFKEAMKNLNQLGLTKSLRKFIEAGKPIMGICLGLQLLFEKSEEFGSSSGIGVIEGTVKKFPNYSNSGEKLKVPHVGWSQIYSVNANNNWKSSPLRNTKNNEYMYFVHSFYVEPKNPDVILSQTNYGGVPFCSSVVKDNICAFQFHPEKSSLEGLNLYAQWADKL